MVRTDLQSVMTNCPFARRHTNKVAGEVRAAKQAPRRPKLRGLTPAAMMFLLYRRPRRSSDVFNLVRHDNQKETPAIAARIHSPPRNLGSPEFTQHLHGSESGRQWCRLAA